MHALYGRRFALFSISTSLRAVGYVDVIYRGYMRLRIPVAATQLAPARKNLGTKLTLESMTELVALAHQCEVLCISPPIASGAISPQPSKTKLSKT
jgi:hypothetical protein